MINACNMLGLFADIVSHISGNYRDLPSAIEKLRPADPLTPAQERAKLRRITHLIHSQLLKVDRDQRMLSCEGMFKDVFSISSFLMCALSDSSARPHADRLSPGRLCTSQG